MALNKSMIILKNTCLVTHKHEFFCPGSSCVLKHNFRDFSMLQVTVTSLDMVGTEFHTTWIVLNSQHLQFDLVKIRKRCWPSERRKRGIGRLCRSMKRRNVITFYVSGAPIFCKSDKVFSSFTRLFNCKRFFQSNGKNHNRIKWFASTFLQQF